MGGGGGECRVNTNQVGLIDILTETAGKYAALPCQHKDIYSLAKLTKVVLSLCTIRIN